MKKSIIAAAVLVALCAPALAADYYLVVPVPGKTESIGGIAVSLTAGSLWTAYTGDPVEYNFGLNLRVTGDPNFTGAGVKWAVSTGSLPAGLALDASTGKVAGNPTTPGTSSFTLTATYKSKMAERAYQLTVESYTISLVDHPGYRTWGDGSYATSCNEYRNPKAPYVYAAAVGDGTYRILPNGGQLTDVYCDMTSDGGGWTRVAAAAGSAQSFATALVDDRGVQYTEVLMTAAADMFVNYSTGSGRFKFNGISPIDGLRFGSTWYFLADVPDWRGYGTLESSPYTVSLSGAVGWPNSNYTVVEANPTASNTCIFSGGYSIPTLCGRKMKVRAPAGARLTGYNDMESLDGRFTDNSVRRNIELYVR